MNHFLIACATAFLASAVFGQYRASIRAFEPIDVFGIEYATDPRIAPDGSHVVYVRNSFDIMKDRRRTNLWIVASDGSDHRPITSGNRNDGSPRWSPDGKKLAYVSSIDGSSQLYMRWMDTGQTAKLTQLTRGPGGLTWSPDGKWLAFSMLVPGSKKPFAKMPKKPKGAEWAKSAVVIDKLRYRADGQGYVEDGYRHLFVVPTDGGTPRQITSGDFNHGGRIAWAPDSTSILFSANRNENWRYEPRESDIYEIEIASGELSRLTRRNGPDSSPVVSPDGSQVAYLGFDDRLQGYQVTALYVMNRDGSGARCVTPDLDRSVGSPAWSADGRALWFQHDDKGTTNIAFSRDGAIETVVRDVGGTSLGRPYSGGSFTLSKSGAFAYTRCDTSRPADVAVGSVAKRDSRIVTRLNEDLLGARELAEVREEWCKSRHDDKDVQFWVATPPGYDASKRYPLVLEIHGGPFANYGSRFAAEIQLYAAHGHVVVYANPRGSTSYGEEFGNAIHHAYPGYDYDDLISCVDATIAKYSIDKRRLYVTGGSGGGVLTSWIVGKTDRFRAAVVQKPVINWYSFVLTADAGSYFYKYWFPGFPWDHQAHYMKRSPLSLVGNVRTPTMLITGEADYRTPMSESEQYYQALRLRKIDSMLVRIPDASHGIARRPSNLIAKVAHVLAWFDKYR